MYFRLGDLLSMEKASKLKSGHSRNPPVGGNPTCAEGVKVGVSMEHTFPAAQM